MVQNYPKFLKKEQNIQEALQGMEKKQADLWVLPEFFATGYNFRSKKEVAKVAENIPAGMTCQRLIEFSKKKNCAVAVGLAEKSGKNFYNSAVLIEEGKVFLYRKTHLFGNEKKFFQPGNTGFWVKKVKGIKVGVLICFDWFFPESARTLALLGAELIAHPANLILPWGPEGMKLRSLENHLFSVTANRIGRERGLKFIGQSQLVSPKGKLLYRASKAKVETRVISINPSSARDKKVTPQNHLFHDRKVKYYICQCPK